MIRCFRNFNLFLLLILLSACTINGNNTSSIDEKALYKAAVGALFNAKDDEFITNIDFCTLNISKNDANTKFSLQLKDCTFILDKVDLVMVDDSDNLKDQTPKDYPYLGLVFGEEQLSVYPSKDEGVNQLNLEYCSETPLASNLLVLLSYFKKVEGKDKRMVHYLKFPIDMINIGEQNETR